MSGTQEDPIIIEEGEAGYSRETPITVVTELEAPTYPDDLLDMSQVRNIGGICYDYGKEELQIMAFLGTEIVWIPMHRINEAPHEVKVQFCEYFNHMKKLAVEE